MLCFFNNFSHPIPDTCSNCGELIAPEHKIISLLEAYAIDIQKCGIACKKFFVTKNEKGLSKS